MKNKFMTKALAVVLSASMALSLSSATALTANAAAAPKLAKKTVSVKAGKKAKNKLKAASYKAGWRITKATVKKTAVAKAKVKKNKKVVVVTGVKKGATKIVLKLKNAKTGAAKKLKFKAKVKVDKPVIEEPVVADVATVTAAKQKTFDTVNLTFDREVDATAVTQETVAINGSVGAATLVTVSGNQATVSYGYAENTEYTFSVTGLNGTASITTGSYAVTDIVVADQTFEADQKDHDVEYTLVAGDVDVKNYPGYVADVVVSFEGDYATTNEDPAKPQISFSEKDKTATVTFTYSNAVLNTTITKSAKITSVAATATEGTARFAGNLKKWYLVDDTTDTFDLFTSSGTKQVVFYAKDANDAAIIFDDVEIKSSNDNIATADINKYADGKYFVISVEPTGEAGTAKFTLTATEDKGDQVSKDYSFTVKVTEKNNTLNKLDLGTTSVKPYNGFYGNISKIKMQPLNSIGQKLDPEAYSYDWEITSKEDLVQPTVTWEEFDQNYGIVVDSLGASKGTYNIKVTITDNESGKELTAKATVAVQDALSEIYSDFVVSEDKSEISGTVLTKFKSTKFEVEAKDLKITDYQGKDLEQEMKVAVKVNSKPIGYLTSSGITGYEEGKMIAQKALVSKISGLDAETQWGLVDLYGVHAYVYQNSNYYCNVNNKTNGVLYLGNRLNDKNKNIEYTTKDKAESSNSMLPGAKYSIYTSTNNAPLDIYYYGPSNKKNTLASNGTYSVKVVYHTKEAQSFAKGTALATGKFNVNVTLTMPKVTYNAKATAEHPVISDVDKVRAVDGASVSWYEDDTNKRPTDSAYELSYTTSVTEKDNIWLVKVRDTRGGWGWDAVESVSGADGTDDNAWKYIPDDLSFVGGSFEGNVIINFMFETKTKVGA